MGFVIRVLSAVVVAPSAVSHSVAAAGTWAPVRLGFVFAGTSLVCFGMGVLLWGLSGCGAGGDG